MVYNKNGKIVIIDFQKNHYDYVISVYEYLYNQGFRNILIYLNQGIYINFIKGLKFTNNHIDLTKVKVYKNKNIYRNVFIDLFKEKPDKIYINTISYGKDLLIYSLLLFLLNFRIIITVHNVNTFFNFTQNKRNIKSMAKKLLINYIKTRADKFIVLNEYIKDYAKNFTEEDIEVIPFKLPINNKNLINNKKLYKKNMIKIVIPGTVNDERRDIFNLLEIIEKILNKRKDLLFIFLGKLDKKNTKKIIQRKFIFLKKNFDNNIIWFENYVSQEKFNAYMIQSNIILAPLNKEIRVYGGSKELYGISKASGAEFDAYKYGKKLIIPYFYRIKNPRIKVIYYQNYKELHKLLKEIL